MTFETLLICAFWSLCAAGLAWYVLTVAANITYVTLADGRRQERRLPLLFRLLLPLAPNLAWLTGTRAATTLLQRSDKRITAAGYQSLLRPDEFLALHILYPAVIGILFWLPFVLLTTTPTAPAPLRAMRGMLLLAGGGYLAVYPSLWLLRARRARHTAIRRSLPFVLDLLTLSVEAGLDFMTALQRNVQRRRVDALTEELIIVLREIQVGKTRRTALRDMAVRVNQPDLRSVVNALVQADELGVSIGSILRIQAEQIRQRRFDHAEKLANEAPVKMLFPLLLCIFPAVFLMLMGPVILRLLQQGL